MITSLKVLCYPRGAKHMLCTLVHTSPPIGKYTFRIEDVQPRSAARLTQYRAAVKRWVVGKMCQIGTYPTGCVVFVHLQTSTDMLGVQCTVEVRGLPPTQPVKKSNSFIHRIVGWFEGAHKIPVNAPGCPITARSAYVKGRV